MSDKYIKKLYEEVCNTMAGEWKIILEPRRELTDDWVEYDKVKWTMDESIENLVDILKKDNTLTFEEKMLKVYEHICLNYVYDANVLFFFRKDKTDPENVKYIAVDWYGRIVGDEWIKNRKTHNRRICYEFSRFYAKALNELLSDNDKLEACMIGDRENLHYVVGLTGEKYSAVLDQDDFNSIKDLTRAKLGLTIKGIRILRDEDNILTKAVEKYNADKKDELPELEELKKKYRNEGISMVTYLNEVLKILKAYNIDPQGIFEYVKYILEEEDFEVEKMWKEVKVLPEKRFARCLTFEEDGKKYLMDSVDVIIAEVDDEAEFHRNYVFNQVENEYPYFGG